MMSSKGAPISTVDHDAKTCAQPSQWLLDPHRVFLNHGSYGACPRETLEYQAELRQRLESSPSDFMRRVYPSLLEPVREEVAQFLSCSPQHLAFLPNTTAGVNAVLRSRRWQAGDEILLTDHIYEACRNVVTHLQEVSGVRATVVSVPFPEASQQTIVEAVLGGVTQSTKLALLDHVTSPTALVFPVETLADLLSARGIEVLIDGAHAPGMLDLQLDRLGQNGVTYYTGNLHKWCCSPKGAAFLWAPAERQSALRPTSISHGFSSASPRGRFLEEFDWGGTFDPTAWLAAPRSLRFLQGLYPGGWSELRDRCRRLLRQGCEIVSAAVPRQRSASPDLLAQMVTLEIAPVDQYELYATLYDQYGIDSMPTTWNGRSLLRLSAAPYNKLSDYHALAAALHDLAGLRNWPTRDKETHGTSTADL